MVSDKKLNYIRENVNYMMSLFKQVIYKDCKRIYSKKEFELRKKYSESQNDINIMYHKIVSRKEYNNTELKNRAYIFDVNKDETYMIKL